MNLRALMIKVSKFTIIVVSTIIVRNNDKVVLNLDLNAYD